MICLYSLLLAPVPYQATVAVHLDRPLATISKVSLGIGVAVWDGHMCDPAIPRLLRNDHFEVIRYPGGSYSDLYHWETRSGTKGLPFHVNIQPKTDFDSFMGLARDSHATPLITVNYGSNQEGTGGADPKEAADWVRYANKTHHFGVKYWEIGNEVYGNGFYNGRGWEIDFHAPDTGKESDRLHNSQLSPIEYGKNMNRFVKEMKAVDPSIKIGAVLCGPEHWPEGQQPDWNTNVLDQCGKNIDFVVIHWYGEGRSAKAVLDSPLTVPKMLTQLKQQIKEHCGEKAAHIKIWMTEGDASGFNLRVQGALFAADNILTWWEYGVEHMDWWDLHNGAHKTFDGALDDQGILSNGSADGDLHEPSVNTPFPPYFGIGMIGKMLGPGDTLLACESSSTSLRVHSAKRRDGRVGVMLINEDPTEPAQVRLDLGVGLQKVAEGFEYGLGDARITRSKSSGSITVPAYTASVLLFAPRR